MTEAVKLRGSLSEKLGKEQVPSYHDLVIKAVATAVAEFPQINVRFLEDKIQVLPEINVGLAVALTEGLIVPVVKQANRKSLIEIAKETQDLISRARENKLKREEVGNASLTITNLGMHGVDSFAAIINPPETTILSLGRIAPRPWVVNGEIAIRSMMTATLSCDHRVIDGVIGGQFLQRFRAILENPYLLL
jgi:pyruvate dehydrogenase E2 component (dihydrolipoamide acetyltransferase)